MRAAYSLAAIACAPPYYNYCDFRQAVAAHDVTSSKALGSLAADLRAELAQCKSLGSMFPAEFKRPRETKLLHGTSAQRWLQATTLDDVMTAFKPGTGFSVVAGNTDLALYEDEVGGCWQGERTQLTQALGATTLAACIQHAHRFVVLRLHVCARHHPGMRAACGDVLRRSAPAAW